ncbi:deoxycytidylate deaminase-like [Haliotis rubra]|uniref:deoxycytidylate deaminase-like n=1 Tax=Haliotis rubra TaxID=36100 RepID=UPI001EE5D1D3|nr:deoxycytidylate deaminase-like [Haliotis rubra]
MASGSETGEVREGGDTEIMNEGRVEDEKGKDYIDWETYFMAMALVCAERSKDPKTQVGACIVNKDKRLVGTGYNGMPDRY